MENFKQEINVNNFNVYNALNLIQEDLGEIYKESGFNPFGEEYILTEDFVIERFSNNKAAKEVLTPNFLNGEKETLTAFSASANNAQEIINKLDEKINSPETPEPVKAELKKLKMYLLCRIELLNNYKKNFKKKKNDLKMYKNILAVDWKTADIFEETFKEQFDVQIAVSAFLEFAKTNSKSYQKELADQKLIQKAREIIKNNQRAQENIQESEKPKVQEPISKKLEAQPETKKISTKKQTQVSVKKDDGMSL